MATLKSGDLHRLYDEWSDYVKIIDNLVVVQFE